MSRHARRARAGSAEAARLFDALNTELAQVEAEIDAEWFWEKHGNHPWASLGIRRDGLIDDPPERLEELGEWLVKHLTKLKAVLNPRLETIMGDLNTQDSAPGVSGDGLSA